MLQLTYELRPKWQNKNKNKNNKNNKTKSQNAVSRSDPLQGSDKNRAGRQQYFCWSASVKRYKRMHSHGEH